MPESIGEKVDAIWSQLKTAGISESLKIVEQITYLLAVKNLDERQTLMERRAARMGQVVHESLFPFGVDSLGRPYADCRWHVFKNMAPVEMFEVVSKHVVPLIRSLAESAPSAFHHLRDAHLAISTPASLHRVVDLLDSLHLSDRIAKGAFYEYLLSKIDTPGENGQFPTPLHIMELMVEMIAPGPSDQIYDPAAGTGGFLVAASEYVRRNHPSSTTDPKLVQHFQTVMFSGCDFDKTMLGIAAMNLALHGVESPNLVQRDSLSQDASNSTTEICTVVLTNPPFTASADIEGADKELARFLGRQGKRAKKTQRSKDSQTALAFLALSLRLLRPGGKSAIVVPDGVLFRNVKVYKEQRRVLVECQKLEAVLSLPAGVFRPYSGASTAILIFTRTDSGGTDHVWFYNVGADGYSLDDKRLPLLEREKLGCRAQLSSEESHLNNLPEILARWQKRTCTELKQSRTARSFCVPKSEIVEKGYDLSISRYLHIEHQPLSHKPPKELLSVIREMEEEILRSVDTLNAMLD